MRRTPSFTDKGNPFRNLTRPSAVVGNHLENRRILRVMDSYFHYPELEGIVEDDESLDAFYFFDGSRFFSETVMEPFNKSELGFSNLLKSLCVAAFDEIGYGLDQTYISTARFTKLLAELREGEYPTFNLFLDITNFIRSQLILFEEENYDGLIIYASDFNYSHATFRKVELEYFACKNFLNSWSEYNAIAKSENSFAGRLNSFVYRSERETNSQNVNVFRERASGLRIFDDYNIFSELNKYINRLSACMNLPNDKESNSNEKDLIEKWLVLFHAFAPVYQSMCAWYQDNENAKAISQV
jgi:hypothetical protein